MNPVPDPETTPQPREIPAWLVLAVPMLAACVMRIWFVSDLWENLPTHRVTSEGFDQHTYSLWAQDIARGDVLSRGKGVFYYSPLYPYLLAAVYKVAGMGNVLAGLILNAFAGVLAAGCAAGLGRKLYGGLAGLMGGLVVAFSGSQMAYESVLIGDGMLTALALGGLWAFVGAESAERGDKWRWLVAGAIFGALVVGRPSNLLPLVALTAWLVWRGRKGFVAKLAAPIFLAGALALPMVVVARNVAIGGEWVLTSNGPINLYLGNAPGAIGTFSYPPGFQAAWARISKLPTAEQPAAWSEQLARELGASPGARREALALKVGLLLNSWDAPDNLNSYFLRDELVSMRWTISPYAIYVLGFGGMVLCLFRREVSSAPVIFAGAFGLSLVIVFISGRYKLPLLGLLAVWAGGGLAIVREVWREERLGRLALAGGVIAAILVAAYPRPTPKGDYVELLRPNEFANHGDALLGLGRIEEAGVQYARGKELFPTVVLFRERLVGIAASEEDWGRVLAETSAAFQAGAVSQRVAELHVIALVKLGRLEEAEQAAVRLRSFFPESALFSGEESAQ